jgi:hypothetical protein
MTTRSADRAEGTAPVALTIPADGPDDPLDRSLLTRNPMLKVLGAGFFGLVAHLAVGVTPAAADAPYPCVGYDECSCCNGRYCCMSGCLGHTNLGCEENQQCWNTCGGGWIYRCCDWHSASHVACICSGAIRLC